MTEGFFKRIKSCLFFLLGLDRLSTEFRKFALMNVVYLISTSTTGIFVTTLLMRVSNDSNVALKYNATVFGFCGASMLVAAILLHKLTNRTVIFIGVTFSMTVYMSVLIFMNSLDVLYPIVAAIHGTASGFYGITYLDSVMKYSTDNTRDVAMNFLGVCGGLVSLVMPLICGYSIGAFSGFTGYYIMFAILFVIATVAVYLVSRLDFEQPDHLQTNFKKLMKKIYSEKVWFLVIHMDFFRGICEGAFSFFLNVLLFSIVKNEGLVGFNTFLAGGASMLSCVIAGKISRPNNRIRLMGIATTLLGTITMLLFFKLNAITVLLLSISNSLLLVFMINPVTTILYNVFDKVPGAKAFKKETFAITECYKTMGRILGVVFIMVMPSGNFWSVLSLALLVCTQYVTTIFAKITTNCIKKYEVEVIADA